MIIASITGPTMAAARAQARRAARSADLLEFRLDLIQKPDPKELFTLLRLPTIATCRPTWEGGAFAGSELERCLLLKEAVAHGASYVDLELRAGKRMLDCFFAAGERSRVILSHHVFTVRQIDPTSVYRRMSRFPADILKLAYMVDDAADISTAIDFIALGRAEGRPVIAIAMGEAGQASRVLYKKFGAWGTYGSVEAAGAAAPGQIPVHELRNLYKAHRLRRDSQVFGVVGNPLRQSKGIYVHNWLFGTRNAVYCKFPVKDLGRFMEKVGPFCRGFSVTLPFKQEIINLIPQVDPAARAIGAVNTLVRRRTGFLGTNSDAPGALDAIEETCPVRGKRMLIIGAGGAARAITYEAGRRGATVFLWNRTEEKARRLAAEFGATALQRKQLRKIKCDIIVNATSVGMTPATGAIPVPASLLRGKVVFDAVYNPPVTRMLREARARGARIVSGVEMYLNQAARQSALFTGVRPNLRRMRQILMKHL